MTTAIITIKYTQSRRFTFSGTVNHPENASTLELVVQPGTSGTPRASDATLTVGHGVTFTRTSAGPGKWKFATGATGLAALRKYDYEMILTVRVAGDDHTCGLRLPPPSPTTVGIGLGEKDINQPVFPPVDPTPDVPEMATMYPGGRRGL